LAEVVPVEVMAAVLLVVVMIPAAVRFLKLKQHPVVVVDPAKMLRGQEAVLAAYLGMEMLEAIKLDAPLTQEPEVREVRLTLQHQAVLAVLVDVLWSGLYER
jgi:hypothetical protein